MSPNRYSRIIEGVFSRHFRKGKKSFLFRRIEIEEIAKIQKIELPKNLGDILYSFRNRTEFPEAILKKTPKGKTWEIEAAGKGLYRFVLNPIFELRPQPHLEAIKILDSTPGIVDRYSQSDEQSLLAKIRYNRLIDIFLGITCYSLQNHLRTTVAGVGQIETDELYVGVDKSGAQYVIPVQAKSQRDKLGKSQILQDIKLCQEKFSALKAIPVGAQMEKDDVIVLFSFKDDVSDIKVVSEKHYRLVSSDQLSIEEIASYVKSSKALD